MGTESKKMPATKIGVTLYNLRDFCKNEEDLDKTLGRVSKIGYQAVQISGIGPIPPEKVRELLDKHDLYCCATHEGLVAFRENIEQVIEKMRILGCNFTAIGSPGWDWLAPHGPEELVSVLNNIGKQCKEAGIIFGYHNHHREFEHFTGKPFLKELIDGCDPEYVHFEIDTHWVQRGGGDPAEWIGMVKNRCHVVHFKDYSIIDGEPRFVEIGNGNLNWQSIIAACEQAGARWYVNEQDRVVEQRDIFSSIEISFKNLTRFLEG